MALVARVFLDAGHGPHNGKGGAFDPGAQSGANTEYAIVKRLQDGKEQAFRDQKPSVQCTPEASIEDVVVWVNERTRPGDVLLALHMNDGTAKSSGVEVVYSYAAPSSRKAQAEKLAAFLAKELGLPNRGALLDTDTPAGKPKPNGNQGLPILRDTHCPAFIIELGFITNKKDVETVKRKGGLAIAEAIRKADQWII